MTEQAKKTRLAPPPEWWQAVATIFGGMGVGYLLFAVLPMALHWDPLGTAAWFMQFQYSSLLVNGLDNVVPVLAVVYLVVCVVHPSYRQVDWRQKLIPWVTFGGVMLPLIPALMYTLAGVERLALGHTGWQPVGYATMINLCAILVPLFNWICVYRILWRDERPTPALTFVNGVTLVASAMLAANFWINDEVWSSWHPAGITMACGTLSAMALAVAIATAEPKQTRMSQTAGFAGLLLAFGIFVVPQLSFEFHSVMAECAARAKSNDAHRVAIRMLRAFGNRDELLRGAYATYDNYSLISNRRFDVVGSSPDFRMAYYWVTGKAFNEVVPPWDVQVMQLLHPDRDLAGTEVGERNRAVKLAESTVTATLEQSNALADMTWTMLLRNTTDKPQEARMEILLPKDAVVSRAVLWVHGVARVARVTGAGTARQAYVSVVTQKRDPLLVSMKGPDRVMAQCFPVPAMKEGGEMKIEFSLQAPVQLNGDKARVDAPIIVDSNFNLDATQATLNGKPYGSSGYAVSLPMDKMPHSVEVKNVPPQHLVVIVDGSASVGPWKNGIVQALRAIPSSVKTDVIFASDEVSSLTKKPTSGQGNLQAALKELPYAPFVGGPDNCTAMIQAYEFTRGENAAVVWIHGPMPMLGSVNLDPPYFNDDSVRFYDVPVGGGTDIYAQQPMKSLTMVHTVADSFGDDLTKFFQERCGVHEQVSLALPGSGPLAAYRHVLGLLDSDPLRAQEIASEAGIVTPVTSAIVLETDYDYQRFGIDKTYDVSASLDDSPYRSRGIQIDETLTPMPTRESLPVPDPALLTTNRPVPIPTPAPAMPPIIRRPVVVTASPKPMVFSSRIAGKVQSAPSPTRGLEANYGQSSRGFSIVDDVPVIKDFRDRTVNQLNALNSYSSSTSSSGNGVQYYGNAPVPPSAMVTAVPPSQHLDYGGYGGGGAGADAFATVEGESQSNSRVQTQVEASVPQVAKQALGPVYGKEEAGGYRKADRQSGSMNTMPADRLGFAQSNTQSELQAADGSADFSSGVRMKSLLSGLAAVIGFVVLGLIAFIVYAVQKALYRKRMALALVIGACGLALLLGYQFATICGAIAAL